MTASGGAAGPARVIDGVATAREIYAQLKERVTALGRLNVRPGLAAVQVGDHPVSKIYLRNKVRACEEAGVYSELHRLEADSPQGVVLAALEKLNRHPRVHGILLNLPLPAHLDVGLVAETIAPEKDVDGLTWRNLEALVAGRPL